MLFFKHDIENVQNARLQDKFVFKFYESLMR